MNIKKIQSPPRELPLSLQITLLLGGNHNKAGWIIVGIMLFILSHTIFDYDLESWYRFRPTAGVKKTQGKIEKTAKTLGGQEYPVFYNPGKTSDGVLPDNLPGNPQTDQWGKFSPVPPQIMIKELSIPLPALTSIIFILLYRLHNPI